MKKEKYIYSSILVGLLFATSSCKKFFDINTDPNNIVATTAPIPQLLTSATVNVGFTGGSDLFRYEKLITQQLSGQSTGAQNQTQDYEKYLLQGSDFNNLWATFYSTNLNDLETIIQQTSATSPNYSGVCKILKAYTYQIMVDIWGDIPYSETQKLTENLAPKYDNDEDLYKALITLLDQGITEVNATTSTLSPGTNSTIYPGAFPSVRNNWVKLANTLKLRIYLHYSEKDPAFAAAQINALINSGAAFFTANSDNFQMSFFNAANAKNPIDQFETARAGYLVVNNTLVTMMNTRIDPRRQFYFTQFPAASGMYKGAKGGDAPSQSYSKIHVYLRGTQPTATTYTGAAPIRLLTFAEYNFIRAEAALRFGSPGVAQTFFQAGITASLQDAGVSTVDIATYVAANGILTGTQAQQLQRIIEEKYVANYGVSVEPWNDWRRTGYPTAIAPPVNAVINFVPRSLYYPQSEIDLNPNAKQKTGMDIRVFWDTRQ